MVGVQQFQNFLTRFCAAITFKRFHLNALGILPTKTLSQLNLTMHKIVVFDEPAQKADDDNRRRGRNFSGCRMRSCGGSSRHQQECRKENRGDEITHNHSWAQKFQQAAPNTGYISENHFGSENRERSRQLSAPGQFPLGGPVAIYWSSIANWAKIPQFR